MEIAICPNCEKEIAEGTKFCPHCSNAIISVSYKTIFGWRLVLVAFCGSINDAYVIAGLLHCCGNVGNAEWLRTHFTLVIRYIIARRINK